MRENSLNQQNKIGAFILIGIGAFFLLGQIFDFSFLGTLWPVFILIPGLVFLYAGSNGNKDTVGLMVPGTVITGTAVIFFYQSLTGHWESWAYIWSLYPVFVGLALTYMGQQRSNEREVNVGRGMVRYGLLGFIVLYLFFEVLIFNGIGSGIAQFIFPALLIGAGIYMLKGGGQLPFITTQTVYEKAKNNGARPDTARHEDSLQRKIDEALAEIDDDGDTTV